MNFDEYQFQAEKTAVYPEEHGIGGLVYTVLGLANEAGEVAGKLKKLIRGDELPPGPSWVDIIGDELGDVLWYVAQVCEELGISMQTVAENNLKKLSSRAERGVLKGSGDKR